MARWYRLDLAPVGAKMLLAICVAALSACAAPLVNVTSTASEPEALALLDASRQAHGGAAAFAAIRNLNVSYEGEWRTLVKQLQPVLVDAQFRSRSQERMLLHEQIIAQLHTGDGLASTQGAAAEVDLWAHRKIGGVVWPSEFFERLRQPIPMLPVHAWRLTGIDINRNYSAIDLSDTGFTGAATTAAGQP